MGRAIAAIASAAAAIVVSCIALAAQQPQMHPGDVLTYDFSIDLQAHGVPPPHSTQAPMSINTNQQGTETIAATRADRDGSVHARVTVAVRSSGGGQVKDVIRTFLIKMAPDGSVQAEGSTDPAVAQYFAALSQASKLYRNRTLHVGDSFSQTIPIPGPFPVTVTTNSKVVGEQMYHGYPTFSIQSTGSGKFDQAIAGVPAAGTVKIAGTVYVDQRDRLFIGEAIRSDIAATLGGAQGARLAAVANVNMVMNSFTHAAPPKSVATAAPTAGASPTPSASPSPSPTPTPVPYNEYYTPTPPAPTPSPVYSAYPPHGRA